MAGGMLLIGGLLGAGLASAATDRPLSVCLLRAEPGMTPRVLLHTPSRFDCRTPQQRWGGGDYWVLSSPLPRVSEIEHGLSVQSVSLWQDRTTLYILYADGTVRRTGFTNATTADHLLLGGAFTMRLTWPHAPSPPVRLLWHVEGALNTRGVVLGATLRDHATIVQRQMLLAALNGAFAGLAIALIVYNLALWGALRQRFQIVYCAMVLCMLGYAINASGAIMLVLPGLANNDRLRINVLLLGASAIAVVLFARAFFGQRVFGRTLRRASDATIAAVAITSLLYAASGSWHAATMDLLRTFAFIGLLALLPPVLWSAWRARSLYVALFALTWGIPLGVAGLRIVQALGIMPWNAWIDNSTVMAMMAEALLSSLAIAYRIKLLSRERDEAREQEIAARMLADTDPLTGLLNRRSFLARAVERPDEQMLLIADLDHFKTVNETIGHDGGDEVLRIVARALRAAVPPSGLVARIGGEEFAIVVDAGLRISAGDILARLRAERMPFDLRVTASIGCCVGPIACETDWNNLYREADRALFEAKAAGRDRVRGARQAA